MVYAQAGDNNSGEWEGNRSPTPSEMFHELPFVTKVWFGATVIVTLSANFGIIDVYQTFFLWDKITGNLEVWRFLACFCYAGRFSMGLLFLLYTHVSFSQRYEGGIPFNTGAGGGTADYAFCWLLGAVGCLLTYSVLGLPPMFHTNMVYYVLYVWSKKHPTNKASIWGFPVQGIYLPFVYLALTVVMGQDYRSMLHGLTLGHLYYFFADALPLTSGKNLLQTPQFLVQYFGYNTYTATPTPAFGGRNQWGGAHDTTAGATARSSGSGGGTTAASPRGGNSGGSGYNWGSGGTRLGTN